jgi:hypothetical protein
MNKLTDQFNLEGCLFVGMDGNKVFLTDQIHRHKQAISENGAGFQAMGDCVDATIAAAMSRAEMSGDYSGESVLSELEYAHQQLGIFIQNLRGINQKS